MHTCKCCTHDTEEIQQGTNYDPKTHEWSEYQTLVTCWNKECDMYTLTLNPGEHDRQALIAVMRSVG